MTHFRVHFTGSFISKVITGEWHLVIINIIIFISFIIPLSFRRKTNWKENSIVLAFFISLFVEMYGIPLTIYFASNIFTGNNTHELVPSAFRFSLLGVDFSMTHAMVYSTIIIIIGTILIILGWVTLYKNIKTNKIVNQGIYSYSRHPQYLGFILVIAGWMIGWPTLLTVIFAPILIYIYLRVSKKEEKEFSKIKEYQVYMNQVPFLL